IITRVTSALYGEYLSNASYEEVNTTAPATLAASFLSNDFAGKTDLQIATTMLTNLGLTSITGLDNWLSAQLTAAGSTTAAKGAKIVSILNDYANLTADATYGTYATSFNAKVAAGLVKSQTAGAAGGSYATADAVAITNGTFTLTTGLDTGSDFTGGAGNDTFNAVDATEATLTSGDSVVGGAGTDTLYLVASAGATTPSVSVSSSGVEVLSIINNTAAAYTFGASLMSGLTNVKVTAGTGATTVDLAPAIVAAEMASSSKNLTVTSTSTLVAGEADSTTLTLIGAASTADTTFDYQGIETLNVVLSTSATGSSTNSSELTVSSTDLEKVVVTGSVAGRLNASLAGATAATQTGVYDASAATGAITAVITNAPSGNMSITGGSANDSFTPSAITQYVTIDGGAGTDTLVGTATYSSTATTQAGAKVTNFEKINASSGTVELTAFPNNTFTETTGAGTYNEVNAGVTKSTLSSGSLTLDRAADTTADALTVDLTGTAATTHAAVTMLDEETITINSAGTGSSGLNHTITALTVADATTLTITGSRGLIVTTLDGEVALKTVNASANTGPKITVDATDSNVAMTITGGAGVGVATTDVVNTLTGGSKGDSITGGSYIDYINGGLGNDTIVGGSGNDSLTGGGGADSISAGDGNDIVNAGSG
ncbi:MAG: beta strand repeat-containing protein, partial [Terrimicrobiaceae bacterium]